jgi:hypothetical protein
VPHWIASQLVSQLPPWSALAEVEQVGFPQHRRERKWQAINKNSKNKQSNSKTFQTSGCLLKTQRPLTYLDKYLDILM